MDWNKSLSVGNDAIDSQHKELIENVEKLKDINSNNLNKKEVDALLNFIKNYTIKHFSEEEALMMKYDYPDLQKHHELHEDFKRDITDSIANIKEKEYGKIYLSSIKVKLGSWLVSHIMNEDKKYMKYIK